jgi:Xaa-Pro aminopeptidase
MSAIDVAPPLAAGLPPTETDLERWRAADRAVRPQRVARLRERLRREGVDGYFGIRRENTRYLTGIELGDGEEKVAGNSGWFFVSAEEVVVLADSRYTLQAQEQCPESRVEIVYNDLLARWPEMIAALRPVDGSRDRIRRLAVEASQVSYLTWRRLADAAPEVELVPVDGWVEEQRQVKEPAELERIASACAVADAALGRLLPMIIPGATEQELALQLEWEMRTSGAEALAFDVACLSGPRAALPHGSPGEREVRAGEVLLFDFGAQVAGYRSDMTRTLFVGEPAQRDREIYELVARAQVAAFAALSDAIAAGTVPIGRDVDAAAREVIEAAGYGSNFGHGLGHGIGLATHEGPSVGRTAAPAPLPSPTVFSIEPGVYLDGETGVRIEDLVLFDIEGGRLERLTGFPREITVVGG